MNVASHGFFRTRPTPPPATELARTRSANLLFGTRSVGHEGRAQTRAKDEIVAGRLEAHEILKRGSLRGPRAFLILEQAGSKVWGFHKFGHAGDPCRHVCPGAHAKGGGDAEQQMAALAARAPLGKRQGPDSAG